MPNPTTAAAWADYLATLDHHTVTRAERKKNMINALDAYARQQVEAFRERACAALCKHCWHRQKASFVTSPYP